MKKVLYLLIAVSLWAPVAQAGMTTRPGGWLLMYERAKGDDMAHLLYGLSRKESIGFRTEFERGEGASRDHSIQSLEYNRLVRRWNFEEAQGNFYVHGAAGVAESGRTKRGAYHAGFSADYETRRLYTLYEFNAKHAGTIETSVEQKARVGFAPYIAGFYDFNTWLILQVDHEPAAEDTVTFTPMARFYYKTYLLEAGANEHKEVFLNFTTRF